MMFFLMIRRPPRSTLFPYTTLFRSGPMRVFVDEVAVLRFDDGTPVTAASGIAPLGDGWLVAQDDATSAAWLRGDHVVPVRRSEEHTSELQSRQYLVCRLLLEKINNHLANVGLSHPLSHRPAALSCHPHLRVSVITHTHNSDLPSRHYPAYPLLLLATALPL